MTRKDKHPLYATWKGMNQRCNNPNAFGYYRYGGRGIKVCDRWKVFENFASDMGERPPKFDIDRIDNNGDYTPENCRWISHKENMRNITCIVIVEIDGVKYKARDLADKAGMKVEDIVARVKAGLTYNEVISPERRRDFSGFSLGGKANGARQKSRTHCKNGHEFSPENTYITKQGWRDCKACRRI